MIQFLRRMRKANKSRKGGDGNTANEEEKNGGNAEAQHKARKTSGHMRFESVKQLDGMIDDYFGRHLAESGEVADIESLADYLCMTRDDLIKLTNDKKYGRSMRFARNRIAKIKKQRSEERR